MPPTFIHLRLHTEYSLSDGTVRVKPLMAALAEQNSPAVAVTDINNLFALVKFYKAATANGIKPIIGTDVWIEADNAQDDPTPLVLLARDEKGYRNISELLSRAYLEGQRLGKALLKKSWLAEQCDGLIALSAGRTGDVGKAILANKRDEAVHRVKTWMAMFPDAFYLELQRTGRSDEETYIHEAVGIAIELECPVVATNDVRFLKTEEYEAHEVRVCIHDGRTFDDPRREHRYSEQQYLRSPEEMCELFADIPEAIENTVEIARRCSATVDLGNYYLPEFPIPEGYTTAQFFCEVSEKGLNVRLEKIFDTSAAEFAEQRIPYDERLAFELGVINDMGFPGYFLIVMEFIQWSKENDIPVGPGRGSGAGSLVAYALLITDVDPLEYDLLFERFLNPERVSLPDFDIDFCMDGRDKVIQHVADQYGRSAVSQIITFGTMAAKAVVRDVARVQGKPYGLADKLSKLIPFDPGMTLIKAQEDEPLLREFLLESEEAQEIMEMALKLEGLTKNVGKHAGGVVIAPTKISDFSPIYCDETGGNFMTQFDKDDVEQAGLVKFDFLGLRTLTIIDRALKSINVQLPLDGKPRVDIEAISLDEPAIYENFRKAQTTAVFQLESRGMKDLMKKVKPTRFGDIVALVALFRPGPMQLADDFIRRKHGIDEVDYLHPSLKHVLEGTYGVMLYQEQVMQIAQVLAGYSLADADLLRRAMGKKKPEEMAKQRTVFLQGAKENDVPEAQAGHIFDLMEMFAGYGFNKPHSVAYAKVAYQTAWLKHHYPSDFMAAVLSADMQTTEKVVINVEECREMKITLAPPDVNEGEFRFVANSDSSIIYGLGAIKGLGEGPIEAIVAGRQDGPYTDMFDFCQRVDARKVNKRAVEALIGSGALDNLIDQRQVPADVNPVDFKRALLLANQHDAVKTAEQKSRNQDSGLSDLFGEDIMSTGNDLGCPYNYTEGLRCVSFKDRLSREKDTLGLYLTGHPIDLYKKELRYFAKTRIVDLRPNKAIQTVAGLIVGMRTMKSKRGETLAFITLDDRSGRLEVAVFADLFDSNHAKLQKDELVVMKGTLSADDFSGGLKMRASEVLDLLQARERSIKCLRLSLNGSGLNTGFCQELASLLQPYKGEGCRVSIEYQRSDAVAEVSLGDAWRVSPDDQLIENLRERYGTDQVQFDY